MTDTNARVRQNIAATLGNLMLQQIEMEAVIESQAAALAAAAKNDQKRSANANPKKES